MTDQIEKKYYTIGEVSKMLNETPSLIRFWEKEIPQLTPSKTEGGTRKYTHAEVDMLKLVHYLVKQKGYTLAGASQYLKTNKSATTEAALVSKLENLKAFLVELKNALKN
ncbi:MAG: MerR family transcriptional regulator [Bacteroidia bacterium]|jgi:DNA-binding transcriptional MerR regulator|nr:MerR family transcriptional regulator [Bacteroidia bacterium]